MAAYNQPGPPFKAKTKAGNVNAWLDAQGGRYEYFVQFDIDHHPDPDYLDLVLGYFEDRQVAWVQAPSYIGNYDTWVARGAAEQEQVLQGPLQEGFYGASKTPFIIGSHCTYRVCAVQEIGGFQPTRAEDHLDSMVLAAAGYTGVYLPLVIAKGSGPATFETYLRQQFAWAYSLMEVLFNYTPRVLRRLSPMQALQFLFAQTWYPLWSGSLFFLFFVPILALLTEQRPTRVSFTSFVVHFWPVVAATTMNWYYSRPHYIPRNINLTWRGIVLHVARWPIVFWAFVNVLFRIRHPYMITPKKVDTGVLRLAVRTQAIYLLGIWATVLTVSWFLLADPHALEEAHVAAEPHHDVQGYVIWAIWGGLFLAIVVAVNLIMDIRTIRFDKTPLLHRIATRVVPYTMLVVTLVAFAITTVGSAQLAVVSAIWLDETSPALRGTAGAIQAREALLTASRTLEGPAPGAPASSIRPMDLVTKTFTVGAYDPRRELVSLPLGIDHWFIRQDEPSLLTGAIAIARDRRTLLVTLEPFPRRTDTEPILEVIRSGERDSEIRAVARNIQAASPQIVLVRWAHEMELKGIYPWAGGDPTLYREAYRRVVRVFQEEQVRNVRWVWSPAGNVDAYLYYPGDDVVDYIGVSVFGDARWDSLFGYTPRSFDDIFRPRYAVLAPIGKPILVAEMGVSGDDERRKTWLTAAAQSFRRYPLLTAAVFFNDVNTPNNPLPTQPDWRLTPSQIQAFLENIVPAQRVP